MDAKLPTRSALFPRGGARRKTGEPSDGLTISQCRSLIDGAARASQEGLPLNRFITISWGRSGLSGEKATAATRAWIKRASDWLRENGSRCAWVYVHEHGSVNGTHVHILIHVPPRLNREFRAKPLRWVKATLGRSYVRKTLKSLKIKGADAPDGVSRETYAFNLTGKLHYMMKAAAPEIEQKLGVTTWGQSTWGRKGRVFGKRAGVWQRRKQRDLAVYVRPTGRASHLAEGGRPDINPALQLPNRAPGEEVVAIQVATG